MMVSLCRAPMSFAEWHVSMPEAPRVGDHIQMWDPNTAGLRKKKTRKDRSVNLIVTSVSWMGPLTRKKEAVLYPLVHCKEV